jgi:hypothetical protein
MLPPKNPSNQTPPTLRQSKDSFKCSARQLARAAPPSNNHDAPGMDAAIASNAVATTAGAMVAAIVAVVATTTAAAVAATAMVVAATGAVTVAAMHMAVAVAMAATMAAVRAVAMEEIRPQAAYPLVS